jgi:hypothetical protein
MSTRNQRFGDEEKKREDSVLTQLYSLLNTNVTPYCLFIAHLTFQGQYNEEVEEEDKAVTTFSITHPPTNQTSIHFVSI